MGCVAGIMMGIDIGFFCLNAEVMHYQYILLLLTDIWVRSSVMDLYLRAFEQ